MHVSILAFDGCSSISSLGSYDLLVKANNWAFELGITPEDRPLFRIDVVGTNRKTVREIGGVSLSVPKTIQQVARTDLVLIPAIDEDIDAALENNGSSIPWIREMYEQGADIASMCTGCFMLAETGLLDGKAATTHWIAEAYFRERYPAVQLQIQDIIVDVGRICSCGGATSFINLIIYLIEKYGGKELASFSSKVFLVDKYKASQNSYAIFSVQKHHKDEGVLTAQQFIESNFGDAIGVDKLADLACSSRRNFIRRFKKATGNTPLEYIQRVRVEAAKNELENTKQTINEIILRVGYEDAASFRKLFLRYTGSTMSSYRDRYRVLNS